MKLQTSLKHLKWLIISYAALILVLVSTDPYHAPLLVVMVPFGLLFWALFLTFNNLISFITSRHPWSRQKRLAVAGGLAWLPVMMLILRSIDQLTLRDGLILLVFVAALLLYLSRTNFLKR